MKNKNDTFEIFPKFAKTIQKKLSLPIISIRSDKGGEFKSEFQDFCDENGISHNFSACRTPQQNGVAERKNRTLQDVSRTLLIENNLPIYFWAEAVACGNYILNRVSIRPILKKTPHELLKGIKTKNFLF